MINGLGRWSESLDRAVLMPTLSSPLIINHQSVLNVHLQSPVSSVSERHVDGCALFLEVSRYRAHASRGLAFAAAHLIFPAGFECGCYTNNWQGGSMGEMLNSRGSTNGAPSEEASCFPSATRSRKFPSHASPRPPEHSSLQSAHLPF